MRRGRSASVILTSPTLRATEVRITTAPLRKKPRRGTNPESQQEERGRNANYTHDRRRCDQDEAIGRGEVNGCGPPARAPAFSVNVRICLSGPAKSFTWSRPGTRHIT